MEYSTDEKALIETYRTEQRQRAAAEAAAANAVPREIDIHSIKPGMSQEDRALAQLAILAALRG